MLRRVSSILNLFWEAHWLYLYISSLSFESGTTQPILPPTSNSVKLMTKNWEAEKRMKHSKGGCEAALSLKMEAIFRFLYREL